MSIVLEIGLGFLSITTAIAIGKTSRGVFSLQLQIKIFYIQHILIEQRAVLTMVFPMLGCKSRYLGQLFVLKTVAMILITESMSTKKSWLVDQPCPALQQALYISVFLTKIIRYTKERKRQRVIGKEPRMDGKILLGERQIREHSPRLTELVFQKLLV